MTAFFLPHGKRDRLRLLSRCLRGCAASQRLRGHSLSPALTRGATLQFWSVLTALTKTVGFGKGDCPPRQVPRTCVGTVRKHCCREL